MRWTALLALLLLVACKERPAVPWPAVGGPVPEVVGTDHHGQPFRLSEKHGPVLLFFGYTFCPDVCPLTLLTIKRLTDDLDPTLSKKLQVVFVTVDPKRDTPERMAEYLAAFQANTIGVQPNDLDALKSAMKIAVEYTPLDTTTATAAEIYTVNHTATLFLIDHEGRLRERFTHGTTPDEMRPVVLETLEAAP